MRESILYYVPQKSALLHDIPKYISWVAMMIILILICTLGGDHLPAVLSTGIFSCIGLAFIVHSLDGEDD